MARILDSAVFEADPNLKKLTEINDPRDNAPLAIELVWRAIRVDCDTPYTDDDEAAGGFLWEGNFRTIVRLLWPNIPMEKIKGFVQQGMRELLKRRLLVRKVSGRHNTDPSLWYVANEFQPIVINRPGNPHTANSKKPITKAVTGNARPVQPSPMTVTNVATSKTPTFADRVKVAEERLMRIVGSYVRDDGSLHLLNHDGIEVIIIIV